MRKIQGSNSNKIAAIPMQGENTKLQYGNNTMKDDEIGAQALHATNPQNFEPHAGNSAKNRNNCVKRLIAKILKETKTTQRILHLRKHTKQIDKLRWPFCSGSTGGFKISATCLDL